MEYGYFSDAGREYVVTTPFPPSPFSNRLFNDSYTMDVTQRMDGGGKLVNTDFSSVPFRREENFFYVTYNGKPHILCRGNGESYSCAHRLYQTELIERFACFESRLRVFIPTEGRREIWTFSVTNTSSEPAQIGLFAAFGMPKVSMQCEAGLDAQQRFLLRTGCPWYWRYEDHQSAVARQTYDYILPDRKPTSGECDRLRFFGCDYTEGIPRAVAQGYCENGRFQQDRTDPIGALHHSFSLAPGQTATVHYQIGSEKTLDSVYAIADSFPDVEAELSRLRSLWEARCSVLTVETPNQELNYLTNYWFKRQMINFARHNRGGTYCPIRNQLQDQLGYAMLDPEEALRRTIKLVERQHFNGYLKQYYNTDGKPDDKLCLMEHSDSYIWLILCVIEVVEKTGDVTNYQLPVGYMDSERKEPLLTHLVKAARFMANRLGSHGLCLMLDGDWSDPVNGPGHKGKGESGWNSMAFVYALQRLLHVFPDAELTAVRDRLTENINTHLWSGSWYAAGINDDGIPYGVPTDTQGQKFLNTQTWAVISGVATGERLEQVVSTIESMQRPFGYVLLDPPFTSYNPIWGRVSAKQSGTTENGSVYCHAVMFKILGDCIRGDGELAADTLLRMLPTNPDHGPEKSRQCPLYWANYYFGMPGENFGFSSYHYRSGTVAWHFWTLTEYILGLRCSATDGVQCDPCLPKAWHNAKVTRRFGGKVYTLTIQNSIPLLTERIDN